MLTPLQQLEMHRDIIIDRIKAMGIRAVARDAGMNAMRVSRYCSRSGADDAATHYILAAVVRRPINGNPIR